MLGPESRVHAEASKGRLRPGCGTPGIETPVLKAGECFRVHAEASKGRLRPGCGTPGTETPVLKAGECFR
ncbi:MAG: hypothetical protein PF795_01910, partial [Kiritimatiellae bacterium]|nr:hypothetical protein [Kiritimatiellia bacterium]